MSFLILNPLSDCVSPIHLNFDALIIRDFPYVPWVLFDLFNSYSSFHIVLKHILYQILEFITHWMRSFHRKNRPIVFPFSFVNHRIELIIVFSFTKWEKANYQSEKNNTGREDINKFSLIFNFLPYLWCLITFCSKSSLQVSFSIFARNRSCISEVTDLDGEVLI